MPPSLGDILTQVVAFNKNFVSIGVDIAAELGKIRGSILDLREELQGIKSKLGEHRND